MKAYASLAILAISLAGCTSGAIRGNSAASQASAGLAGTQWQLVEIQSMDDSQGTTRPDDPGKYTLFFGKYGRVTVRLDCNRGNGPWKSAEIGSLEIGPLATTRAICPPPSLGDKLATDLGYVRFYTRQGRRLALALMADGGILVWEPVPQSR